MSNNNSGSYLVVNQWATSEPRSPLADVDKSSGGTGEGLILREHTGFGYLVLRGSDEHAGAVQQHLGLALPVEPLKAVVAGERCIRWISPDEWLITVPAAETADIEAALRNSLGSDAAVVDNSGGFATIQLSGEAGELVIRKSTGYDIHERNFPPGKVVTTTFAQAQCVMRRLEDHSFELIVRRSFADYIWRWLRDAATEYGFSVETV